MVDVIGIHAELTSEEIGKSELDERVLTVIREVPRHPSSQHRSRQLPTRNSAAYRVQEDDLAAIHGRTHDRPSRPAAS